MAELPEKQRTEWIKKLCANDPWADYDPKVLLIKLYDVTYGPDLSRYLDSKELDYYVERFDCETPLEFYIIGSFDDQAEVAEYVYNTYDNLDVERTFHWVESVDGWPNDHTVDEPTDDDYTVHELTGCTLEEFREKVRTLYNDKT